MSFARSFYALGSQGLRASLSLGRTQVPLGVSKTNSSLFGASQINWVQPLSYTARESTFGNFRIHHSGIENEYRADLIHESLLNGYNHDSDNKKSHQGNFFILGYGAATMGLFAVKLAQKEDKEYSLEDLTRLEQELIDSMGDGTKEQILIKSMLENIRSGNTHYVEKRLLDLALMGFAFNKNQFESLIKITALYAKVDILELMSKSFGKMEVNSIPLARQLLSHESRDIIQRVTSGSFNYYYHPEAGLFNDSSSRVYLAKSEDAFQQSRAQYELQPGADIIDDMYLFINYVKENNDKLGLFDQSILSKYRNTLIIPDSNGHAELDVFLKGLKNQAMINHEPAVGTIMITGCHFTQGMIKVEQDGEQLKATFLYFDSLGSLDASFLPGDYISILRNHFPNIEIKISESKLQTQAHGCPLFAHLSAVYGIESDKTLAALPQYNTQEYKENFIFNYAEDHTVHHLTTPDGDGKERSLYYYDEKSGSAHVCDGVTNFLPPVFMTTSKCSFTRAGHNVVFTELVESEEGKESAIQVSYRGEFKYFDFEARTTNSHGHMGIRVEQERGNKDRLAEYQVPARAFYGLSPTQEIERNTGIIGGRPVNETVRRFSGVMGVQLAQWLPKQSPEKITAMTENPTFHSDFASEEVHSSSLRK